MFYIIRETCYKEQVNVSAIPLFFLMVLIGVATTGLAFRLKNSFPYRFLMYFMYFVLFFNIYGFIKLAGGVFISLMGGISADLYHVFFIILPILYTPAVCLYMYMLFRWIWELMDSRMTGILTSVFWCLQAAAFGFHVVGIILHSKKNYAAGEFIAMRDFILIPLLFAPLVFNAFKLRSIRDTARKRLLLVLGTYYLAGFCLYFILIFFRFPYYHDANAYYAITSFSHFFLHLPPLLYLGRFLKIRGPELTMSIRDEEKPGIERLFAKYGITERERAIVMLIIRGKSNAEIGRELFIATKTVKNNIFNIYRKTGVRNRVQLTNLLRGF